jgi:hypothetical protein
MAHRVAARAADDLDGIWCYVANESGSIDVANAWSIRSPIGFSFSPAIPTWAVSAIMILAPDREASLLANTSSSTVSRMAMCSFYGWRKAAAILKSCSDIDAEVCGPLRFFFSSKIVDPPSYRRGGI